MTKQSPVLTSAVISPMIIDMAFDMKEEHDKDFNCHILPFQDSVSQSKAKLVFLLNLGLV